MPTEYDCGCGEGKLSLENPIMVSIRCAKHRNVPAVNGSRLMFLSDGGHIVFPSKAQRKMAIPSGRRRRPR